MSKITHKLSSGHIEYDETGIHFSLLFGLIKQTFEWSEIEFCSITPAVKKIENEWKFFDGRALADSNFINNTLVLKDRHHFLKHKSFLKRMSLISILNVKPLFDAEDKPYPSRGLISFDVKLKSLSVSRLELIDFWAQKMKFNLIVFM